MKARAEEMDEPILYALRRLSQSQLQGKQSACRPGMPCQQEAGGVGGGREGCEGICAPGIVEPVRPGLGLALRSICTPDLDGGFAAARLSSGGSEGRGLEGAGASTGQGRVKAHIWISFGTQDTLTGPEG
ncbi:hypothetical protein AAFF_G00123620 [Aldrovandia affinis]|uniref:Uncharacterized protein n=1 Tax=Aldrovandia affinis TaxID=143900 RepID=A0AAD7W9R4_9TELE|nr:hypothetical protein AAFF_G00123620 [Aldrovandia affinis]